MLWAYSKLARLEYLPAVIPGLIMALALSLPSREMILSPYFIEAFSGLFMAYMSGFIINALGDYEIDKTYGTYKGDNPRAVDLFTKRGVWALLAVHTILPMLFSLHLAMVFTKPLLPILLGLGYVFGLGYSVPPFNFKVKGIWHPVSLACCAFLFPLLYIYILFSTVFSWWAIAAIVGITVAHYSLAITNQGVDYFEDKQYGVENPTVKFGLARSLKYSGAGLGLGFSIIVASIIMFSLQVMAETTLLGSYLLYIPVAIGALLFFSYSVPMKGTVKLYRIARTRAPDQKKSWAMKNYINYSRWQASGIIGLMIVLVTVNLTPVLYPIPHSPSLPGSDLESYSVEVDARVEAFRDRYSYKSFINVSVTNTGRDIREGNIYLIYDIGTAPFVHRSIPLGTALPSDMTINVSYLEVLPDRSNITIKGEVAIDPEGDGYPDVTSATFERSVNIKDMYFPLAPKVKSDTHTNALYSSVDLSVINLGSKKDKGEVYIRITSCLSSNPSIQVLNLTVYPDTSLYINQNWTETKIFSQPLWGDYDLTITLYLDDENGRRVMDRYVTTISYYFF